MGGFGGISLHTLADRTHTSPAGQRVLFGSFRKWGRFPMSDSHIQREKSPDRVHKSSRACSFISSFGSVLINHPSIYRKLGLLKINIIFMPTFFLGYLSKIYFILSSLLKSSDLTWKWWLVLSPAVQWCPSGRGKGLVLYMPYEGDTILSEVLSDLIASTPPRSDRDRYLGQNTQFQLWLGTISYWIWDKRWDSVSSPASWEVWVICPSRPRVTGTMSPHICTHPCCFCGALGFC